jgi:hypothetical protein
LVSISRINGKIKARRSLSKNDDIVLYKPRVGIENSETLRVYFSEQ